MKRVMTVAGMILLVFSLLIWVGMVLMLATMNDGTDSAGRGMGYFMALGLTVVLWLLISVLMFIAAKWGDVPPGISRLMLVLVPFAFASGVAVVYSLTDDVAPPSRVPVIVGAAVPLLVMAYFLWATLPSLQRAVPAGTMTRVTWGLVLALSLVPWPLLVAKNRRVAAAQARFEASEKAREDSVNRALESKLAALTPNTPLRDWLIFATAGNDLRERTLERIRALPRRQADAEAMRGDDIALLMSELRNLGLVASPALCASANDFLVTHAGSFRRRAAPTESYETESDAIERYLFGMQWLADNKCDLSRSINAYDSIVSVFAPGADRDRFISRLASLRP